MALGGHHSVRWFGATVHRSLACQMGLQQALTSARKFYPTQEDTYYWLLLPLARFFLTLVHCTVQPRWTMWARCLLMMGVPTLAAAVLGRRVYLWVPGSRCRSGQWGGRVCECRIKTIKSLPFTWGLGVVFGRRPGLMERTQTLRRYAIGAQELGT